MRRADYPEIPHEDYRRVRAVGDAGRRGDPGSAGGLHHSDLCARNDVAALDLQSRTRLRASHGGRVQADCGQPQFLLSAHAVHFRPENFAAAICGRRVAVPANSGGDLFHCVRILRNADHGIDRRARDLAARPLPRQRFARRSGSRATGWRRPYSGSRTATRSSRRCALRAR